MAGGLQPGRASMSLRVLLAEGSGRMRARAALRGRGFPISRGILLCWFPNPKPSIPLPIRASLPTVVVVITQLRHPAPWT